MRAIEQSVGSAYSVNRFDDASLAAVGLDNSTPTVRERFGLPLSIRRFAPGSEIDLPITDGVLIEQLYGLGGARSVAINGSELGIDPDRVAHSATTLVEGVDRSIGPYTIALDEPPVERLVGQQLGDNLWFVDARLLEEEREEP